MRGSSAAQLPENGTKPRISVARSNSLRKTSPPRTRRRNVEEEQDGVSRPILNLHN